MFRRGHAVVVFATPPSPLYGKFLPKAEIGEKPLSRRQRAKIWELNPSVHCSVIGTCLTTAELRSAMGKILKHDVSTISDHDLHSRAVGLCERQGDGAKILQKTLDRRHELAIRRFGRLDGEDGVLGAWTEARRAGDIPGAYWALLTHPDTGHDALKRAFGDVHMLSHLVGASNRADIRRLAALEEENAALRDKVERQQARMQEAVTSRDTTIHRLSALLAEQVQAAAPSTGDDEAASLRVLVGELERRHGREAERRQRTEQRLAEAAAAAKLWQSRAEQAAVERQAVIRELERFDQSAAGPPILSLPTERILYVGGRPHTVEQIRTYVEDAGGVLLRHDGGQHENPALLAGLIGAADRVAFPVDCVSHDAMHTIKRLCRQLGKPWIALRSSGLGSFLAAFTVDLRGEARL